MCVWHQYDQGLNVQRWIDPNVAGRVGGKSKTGILGSSAQLGFVPTLSNPDYPVFFPLTAVQKKAALEKESKLNILEAGVADVSASFYLPSPSILILKTGILESSAAEAVNACGSLSEIRVRGSPCWFSQQRCMVRWSELRGGSLLWLM